MGQASHGDQHRENQPSGGAPGAEELEGLPPLDAPPPWLSDQSGRDQEPSRFQERTRRPYEESRRVERTTQALVALAKRLGYPTFTEFLVAQAVRTVFFDLVPEDAQFVEGHVTESEATFALNAYEPLEDRLQRLQSWGEGKRGPSRGTRESFLRFIADLTAYWQDAELLPKAPTRPSDTATTKSEP